MSRLSAVLTGFLLPLFASTASRTRPAYLVKDIGTVPTNIAGRIASPVAMGGTLFFLAGRTDGLGRLWRSDGTAAGTRVVASLDPAASPSGLTAIGSSLFFVASSAEHGREPWKSDGTAAGTRLMADIAPASLSSIPWGFTPSGPLLYFSASDGVSGRELWAVPTAALEASPRQRRPSPRVVSRPK